MAPKGFIMSHPGSQYEFSSEDNAAIRRLAVNMRRVGSWLELYGALLILAFVVRLIPWKREAVVTPLELLTGLLLLFLGNRTRRGARSFRSIVTTEGHDVSHLMDALRDLTHFYGLIDRVVLVVLFLAIVIGIFLSVAL